MRNKSAHMVSVLDLTTLKDGAIEYLKSLKMWDDNHNLKPIAPWGSVRSKSGSLYLICSEGVGSEYPLHEKESRIEWFMERVDKKGNVTAFNAFASCATLVNETDVLGLPVLEIKSLDEFIRSNPRGMGRLEDNFNIWENALNR